MLGFGAIYHPGKMHNVLQQGKMVVKSQGVCEKKNKNSGKTVANYINIFQYRFLSISLLQSHRFDKKKRDWAPNFIKLLRNEKCFY